MSNNKMTRVPNKKSSSFGYQKSLTVGSSSFGSSSFRKDKGVENASNITMIKDVDPMLDNITDSKIQVYVKKEWMFWFDPLFKEGQCYAISNFAIVENSDVIGSVVAIGDVVPVQSVAGRMIRRTVVIEDSELSTLVNIMDRNDVRPIKVSINTMFLNSLQPEWSKYVTLNRQNKNLSVVEYDALYDALLQFEPHVQASKAKRAAKNHDPLALIAHSNAFDYEEDYQRELQGNAQEDKLTIAMMVDIQTKNACYCGNGNRNAGRQNRNQAANAGNGHYACDCPKPKVCDEKYFREQMLLAMKDEAGGTINDEENDFNARQFLWR
ncbi:hypothetical protein Tco_0726856 [Tanacetum coccineum]|uniref:Uncharacterized protein n=1 Tax=Tanacetum coccineum TaxID=301880 RepID=A0ABQ4YJ17_9ASTR